ncbi:MAG TPA: SgcJ/EcaC family oxidoreductase [Gemmatimonadaceae bacterium]|jgi:uncharacterized protein (TIGR02246 family)
MTQLPYLIQPRLVRAAQRARIVVAFALGGAPLVTGSARAQTAIDTTAVLASARPDIAAGNAAWLPGLKRKDAKAITAAFADSAVFITADGTIVRGRPAITRMYEERFPSLGKILRGEVVSEGLTAIKQDLVYEWGHATLEMASATPGGPPRRGGGAYLTVWKRSADGHWLIVRNLAM